MPVASHIKAYLEKNEINYEVIAHPATSNSLASARAAHIPGENMLKSVVVHCDEGYVLAVVPSTHRVELGSLQEIIEKRLGLATEEEVGDLFKDCQLGAVPPIGEPYGLTVLLDDSLDDIKDFFFEGGDHKSLIHVEAADFKKTDEKRRTRPFQPSRLI